MKAKELMIGDWVYVSKNFTQKYHKVRYIDDDGGIGCRYVNEHGIECKSALVMDYVQPIQLTKEILEKNLKFVTENQYRVVFRLYINENDCIQCTKYTTTSERGNELMVYINGLAVSIHVRYVHEIQHALRVCGLNEFADNFKI